MGQTDMPATLDFGGNSLSKHTIHEVTVLTHKLTSGASNRLHPPSDYYIREVVQEYGILPHSRTYYCLLFSLYHMFIVFVISY